MKLKKEVRNNFTYRLLTISDDIGVIESVKSVGNIISPVSGEITEINEELADDASTINKDPYDDGTSKLLTHCYYNCTKRMAGQSDSDRRYRTRGTDGRRKVRRILRRRRQLELKKIVCFFKICQIDFHDFNIFVFSGASFTTLLL